MAERGVLASSPGEALNLALQGLQVDLKCVEHFKAFTERPESLSAFSADAQWSDCIGADRSVKDVWREKLRA
jgi:hypothetical protein